jgi:hypothetical protein
MLTAAKVKTIHADIDAALAAVAKKHGLNLGRGTHIRYNAETFKLTAEFGDKSSTGEVDPKFLMNLKRYGWEFDLDEKDIGKTFNVDTLGECKFTGMSGRIKAGITQLSTGKGYVMRAEAVAKKLGKKPIARLPNFA